MLIYPKIFIIIAGFIGGMIVNSFYFPCLTKHLYNNYGLTIRSSSLFFVIPTVAYVFVLQFLDSLTPKFGLYLIYLIGSLLLSLSTLFFYPCPPIPNNLIFIIIGFLINGVGGAPVFIPGLILLSKNIRIVDPNIDELTANDISSAINNLTIDVGEFIGPIVGGFFTSRYNFKFCCFIIFCISISINAIFFLYFFKNIKDDISNINLGRKINKEIIDNNMDENVDNNDDNLLPLNTSCGTIVQFNSGFLGGFKFECISKRRNSYANMFRKSRLSKVSLESALTK